MLNPHQNIKEWLNSIDNSNLVDIAFVLSRNSYFKEVRDVATKTEDMLEKFWQVIDRYAEPGFESADFYVTFKSIFDFNFKNRFTESGWNVIQNHHIEMLNDPNLTPNMKDHLERMLSALPERKNFWLDLHKKWEYLKENALSDSNISDWRDKSFFENFNQEIPTIN